MELPAGPRGERHRLRRGGFTSRVAAERARAYWLGNDADPDLSVVTVGQWLEIWLLARQASRPATQRIYRQLVRDYLKPGLGWCRVDRPEAGAGAGDVYRVVAG